MKLDFEIRAVFLRFRRIGMVFFQKQFRSCQAEAVNALFYIPHHKHIVLAETLTGNCLQQLLLYQVAVLILIHQHFPVLHASVHQPRPYRRVFHPPGPGSAPSMPHAPDR